MTVSSATNSTSYAGNGVTTLFAVPFYFLENSHLRVTLIDNATTLGTVLTLNADYTVSGAGNQAGGSVTISVAPATGTTLLIVRVVPVTQETDYVSNDPFPAETHERALDKLTMIAQQVSAQVTKSLRVQDYDPDPTRLPAVAVRANQLLSFDNAGNPIAVAPANGSAVDLALDLANAGDVQLGAAMIGRSIQVVQTVDDIRSLVNNVPSKAAFALCHTDPQYGGGGHYEIDAADLVSADNNGTILVAGDGARWKLRGKDWVDVRDFGALADDSTDATAAIQAAIDWAVVQGLGQVRAPGRYHITDTLVMDTGIFIQGITLVGDGADNSRIRQTGVGKDALWFSTTQFLRNSGLKDIGILCDATAGHGVNIKYGCTVCRFQDVNVTVLNPNKSLYYGNWSALLVTDPHGVFDTVWDGGDLYCSATHAVNPIDFVMRGTTFNENTIRNMRWNGNNAPVHFARFTNVDNATWLTNCLLQNINFELCKFGGPVMTNVRGWACRGFSFWDVGSAYADHLVFFAANAGLDSQDNTVERIARHGDSLGVGVYEVFTEDAQDTTCINVSAIVGSAYNWNNKRVFVIGQSLRAFSINVAGYRDPTNWAAAGGTFASTTGASSDNYGVASIVRDAAGLYTVTLALTASNSNYQISLSYENSGVAGFIMHDTQSTTSFRIVFLNSGGTAVDPGGKITFTVHD